MVYESRRICRRSRFPAAEISIHTSGVFVTTVSNRVVYADLQKMKLLGSESRAL